MASADWEDWDNFVRMQKDIELVSNLHAKGYTTEEIIKETELPKNWVLIILEDIVGVTNNAI